MSATFPFLRRSGEPEIGGLHVARYGNGGGPKAALFRATEDCTEYYGVGLAVQMFDVRRYTPCGAWVRDNRAFDSERFVNLRAGKQWASASEAEALEQLYHRKRAQVKILSRQLSSAEEVLEGLTRHRAGQP